MTALSFPDVDVWLALLLADHTHRPAARAWWESDQSDKIAFAPVTQISALRLLTTSAAMNGKPLMMSRAWRAYDRLYEDERVTFLSEPIPWNLSSGSDPLPEWHLPRYGLTRISSLLRRTATLR